MDARDSAIASLQHKLNFQKMEATKYGKQVVELEEKLTSTEQELMSTKQTLEEKTTALTQARKHLKNSRERTMVSNQYNNKLCLLFCYTFNRILKKIQISLHRHTISYNLLSVKYVLLNLS